MSIATSIPAKETPTVTSMRVIPVAGHDGMLLNLSGAHSPFFTRNVVVLSDNSGRIGVGEVPGGEKIRRVLEESTPLVVGQPLAAHQDVLDAMVSRFADYDKEGRGQQTFDQRTTIHATTAVESALLDLLGQFLSVPVAALSRRSVSNVPVLKFSEDIYFLVGDRRKTGLPYRSEPDANDPWLRLRHEEALTTDRILQLAEAAQARYGFNDFKLKGGVLTGAQEMETAIALVERFPNARASLSIPMAPGRSTKPSVSARVASGRSPMQKTLAAPSRDSQVARSWRSFRSATSLPTATNMVATRLARVETRCSTQRNRHPTCRSAFLDDARLEFASHSFAANVASPGARTPTTTSTSLWQCLRTWLLQRPAKLQRSIPIGSGRMVSVSRKTHCRLSAANSTCPIGPGSASKSTWIR